MVHRVAVIGAGPSGLASIKACLDEGMVPTCFESSDDLGGLWRFKEVSESNRASIYRMLTINASKEMMCYSDFSIPADYPNYMHHSKILKYLKLHAEHFKVLQHIRFQVDYVTYMDDVAGEIGVRPSLLWLFFTDYPLFKKVLWEPATSYQYRLMGPGKWEGARRAIFTQFDRVNQPLKTRQLREQDASITGRLFKLSLTVMAGAASIYYIHVRNPTTIPTLLSKLRPQTI